MIAHPFPTVWHKAEDDGEHLDIDTVEDWAKLFTAFTAEWLDLDSFLASGNVANNTKVSGKHIRDEL